MRISSKKQMAVEYGNSIESVIDVLMGNLSLPESWNPSDLQASLSQGPLLFTSLLRMLVPLPIVSLFIALLTAFSGCGSSALFSKLLLYLF